jgi:hypothetical protein
MSHTFLLEPGNWIIKGTWLDKKQIQIPFKGAMIVTWNQSNWFQLKTKIVFTSGNMSELTFEYKGLLPANKSQYAYVLKRSDFENIEGEGWVCSESIVQRYWVLGDNRHRNGFETYVYLDDNTYHLTSGMMAGNHLINTMEGFLERHG